MAVFTAIGVAIAAIGGAITSIGSWTIGLGVFGKFAVGHFILRTAVQLGVSALAKAMAGDGPQAEPFGIQGNIRSGGTVPRSFILGPSLTAGSLVWHTEWRASGDNQNNYYTQVIAVSDLPVAGLGRWFINGSAVTLAGAQGVNGYAALEFNEGGVEHAWIKFHDGTQTVADPFLTGTVSAGAPRYYAASRVGFGVAYAIVTFRVNADIFTGFPLSKFVLDGVELYDISKDTTQGGNGLQRWENPETWGGDGDALPAVQAYNMARGFTYGGDWFYGLQGLTAARLPGAHWVAQVEKCRADAAAAGGGFESLYRCAGEITVDAEIGTAFEAILTSCAGRMSEVGGVFKIYVGAPDAPIAHFTDSEIESFAPQFFTPFFGLSDTINGVIGSYPSPNEGYVMRSTSPLYNANYEAIDGNRRLLTSVSLVFVPFPVQAQRLLQGELNAARRARRHTHTLPAKFRKVEPGDVVTWTSARNGYIEKQFRVDGVLDLPNCDVLIDITEVDPTDYDFDLSTDYTPPEYVPIPVQSSPGVTGDGFSFWPVSIVGGTGAQEIPALRVSWLSGLAGVSAVDVQVEEIVSGDLVAGVRLTETGTAEGIVASGIIGGVSYRLRGRYVSDFTGAGDWADWVTVAALSVGVPVAPDIADVTLSLRADPARVVAQVQISHPSPTMVVAFDLSISGPGGFEASVANVAAGVVEVVLDYEARGFYTIQVVARGYGGVVSVPAVFELQLALTDLLPDVVPGFRVRVLNDLAHLTWDAAGFVVDHYHIRHLPVGVTGGWSRAVDVESAIFGRAATVPALPGSYLIKAVSIFGNASAAASLITSGIVSLSGINAVTIVTENPAFSGRKNAGLSVGGGVLTLLPDPADAYIADGVKPALLLDMHAGIYGTRSLDVSDFAVAGIEPALLLDMGNGIFGYNAPDGEIEYAGTYYLVDPVDLSEVYTSRVSARIVGYGYSLNSYMSGWGALSNLESLSEVGDAAWSINLYVRVTLDDPLDLGVVWSDWQLFRVGDYVARGFEFKVVLQSFDLAVGVNLTDLSVTIDMPDRVEAGDDIDCPLGGVYIDFVPPFKERPAIAIDGQGLPVGAEKVRTNATRSGFHLKFTDAAGADVSGSFDWLAKGYGRSE